MGAKLKPCPFCGSYGDDLETIRRLHSDMWKVLCINCNTNGPEGNEPEEAERIWNDRADLRSHEARELAERLKQ